MKKTHILYYILALLIIASAIILFSESNSTWRKVYTDFNISDTSSVYRVFLADKAGHQSDLIKQPDGTWEVNGKYQVREDGIELLLETMMKLAVRQAVPRSAHNNVVARLGAIATKVEIYQHKPLFRIGSRGYFTRDKLSKVYYVGDATQDNRGTYMLMNKSSRPFIMHIPGFRGFLTPRYSAKEEDWRSHGIFKYKLPEIKSVQIDFIDEPWQSFRVENLGGPNFALLQLKSDSLIQAFDTVKVLDLLVSFTDVRFENFLTEMDPEIRDSIASTRPMHIITVVDSRGIINKVLTFPKQAQDPVQLLDGSLEQFDLDRLYLLINDGEDLVLGQYFVFDRILQPLSFYTLPTEGPVEQ